MAKIVHAQIVNEVTEEPDYTAAFDALKGELASA